MNAESLRRVPWTCRWACFGGEVELCDFGTRVDDVFWTCLHANLSSKPRLLMRDECETCRSWEPREGLPDRCEALSAPPDQRGA